jgi:hypothetical protein
VSFWERLRSFFARRAEAPPAGEEPVGHVASGAGQDDSPPVVAGDVTRGQRAGREAPDEPEHDV